MRSSRRDVGAHFGRVMDDVTALAKGYFKKSSVLGKVPRILLEKPDWESWSEEKRKERGEARMALRELVGGDRVWISCVTEMVTRLIGVGAPLDMVALNIEDAFEAAEPDNFFAGLSWRGLLDRRIRKLKLRDVPSKLSSFARRRLWENNMLPEDAALLSYAELMQLYNCGKKTSREIAIALGIVTPQGRKPIPRCKQCGQRLPRELRKGGLT